MAKLNYIGNDKSRGLVYDWPAIRKKYKSLGCPSMFYNPATAPLEKASWFVEMSERASGKTTNWLLLGLCMFWMYGTVTIYAKAKADLIAPKNTWTLFDIILDNHYIEKLTDNKYNTVHYNSRKWYLAKADNTGKVIDVHPDHFCFMVSLDKAGDLKSSVNEPKGDLFIYDEFIPINTWAQRPNEIVPLVDTLSTIFRLRECGKVVMLANTIDKYNQYLHDLEIFERVMPLQPGDNCIHTTDKGTKIYIELVGPPQAFKQKKKRWTELFAGFAKPELSPITGEATWAVKNYPHIPYEGKYETLSNCLYIDHLNKLLRIDFVNHEDLGLLAFIHWASRTYDDSIIFSDEYHYDSRYHYGTGEDTRAGKILKQLLQLRRVYFVSNDVGTFFESYFSTVSSYRSLFM